MKMNLALALCFMCGFFANLPSAFTISCYSCVDYPGSSEPCSNPSVLNCEWYFDSCLTLDVTSEYYGMSFTTTVKNCTVSSVCSSSFLCDTMNSTIAASSGVMTHCSPDCCQGDLCNGQVKKRTLLKLRETKREAAKKREEAKKRRQLTKKTVESIRESLVKIMAPKKT